MTDGRYRYIRNFHPHRHRGILAGYPHGQVGWQSFYALQQAGKTNEQQSSFWNVPQPVEELYDTETDPWEVNNLARDPRYKDVLATMRQATLTKMHEIRDTGLVPEAMYNELSAKGTVYEYVHDDAFPYIDVLELALTAGDGQADALPQLKEAMHSDLPVIRYWSALGCTIQGKSASSAATSLRALLRDPVPVVRIAAAEALVAQGDTATGLDAITTILGETNDDMVALAALNVAAALGLTEQIPWAVYARACAAGSYPGRLAEDYPALR